MNPCGCGCGVYENDFCLIDEEKTHASKTETNYIIMLYRPFNLEDSLNNTLLFRYMSMITPMVFRLGG
jgi:hypothetical protein